MSLVSAIVVWEKGRNFGINLFRVVSFSVAKSRKMTPVREIGNLKNPTKISNFLRLDIFQNRKCHALNFAFGIIIIIVTNLIASRPTKSCLFSQIGKLARNLFFFLEHFFKANLQSLLKLT